MDPKPELLAAARAAAVRHGLFEALVCAVVEQESAWNPWAIRYEPAFYLRYVEPQLPKLASNTEARARAFSWGLMQVMGQVARERGYAGRYLSGLLDPAVGLDIGCAHLAAKMAAAEDNVERALLLWNGGGNKAYPAEVMARVTKYEDKGG